MLQIIQLMVHLPLLSILLPSNLTFIFQIMVNIANFKIIPVNWLITKILRIKETTKESVAS